MSMDRPKKLRKYLFKYVPGNSCPRGNKKMPDTLQIQLIGIIGHGKSSLINSCLCAYKGVDFRDRAGASSGSQTVTTRLHHYGLTANIILIDNAGAPAVDKNVVKEVIKQTGGIRKPGEEVTWDKGWFELFKDWFRSSDNSSCIIPVIVFKATYPIPPKKMEDLVKQIDKTSGITPLVVITFVDEFDGDMEQLKGQFASLHCPHVFAVTCYNKESKEERDEELDKTLLDFLVACTDVAEQKLKML